MVLFLNPLEPLWETHGRVLVAGTLVKSPIPLCLASLLRWVLCCFARTGLIKLHFQPDLLLTSNNFLIAWSERDLWARTKWDVSVPAARETRKLIKREGRGKEERGWEGREAESESGFQTGAPQLLVYCNYPATEEIKRWKINFIYKKINVLNHLQSSHSFNSLYNAHVQSPDHLQSEVLQKL